MHRLLHKITTGLPLLAFFLSMSTPGQSAVIQVEGYGDSASDGPALRQALLEAEPGDTLLLSGVFQLDGERLLITTTPVNLRGVLIDNDHDGETNEDWLDGADNDGDGSIDEDGWDAVIRGVSNPDGSVATSPDPNSLFNRGLVLQGAPGTARRVSIRHLKFESHLRAFTLDPEVDASSNLCEESIYTGGRAVHVDLRDNFFTANDRAVQAIGDIEDLRIRDNLFVGNNAVDLLFFGNNRGCVGGAGSFAVGRPTDVRIRANLIRQSNIGLFTDQTSELRFRGNIIDEVVLGVFVRADRYISILGNHISRALRAVTAAQPAPGARISNNHISEIQAVGILLQNLSSMYLVSRNRYDGTGLADVQLDSTTSGNIVFARPGVRVLDEGTGNLVVQPASNR